MSNKGNRFEQKHNRYLGSVPDVGRIVEETLEYNPTEKQIHYYNRLCKECAKYNCDKPAQPKTRSEYSKAIEFYLDLKEKHKKKSSKVQPASDDEVRELLALFDKMTPAQRVRFIGFGEGMLGEATAGKKKA